MHHLPRILSPGEKSDSKAATNSRKMKQKPRLDRLNAAKHIDYDAASTTSSLGESSSSSSLISRSLDLPDQTSFRIEGVEGVCQSLGLSGHDGFAIPVAVWEARTVRSSSDLSPRSRLEQLDTPKETVERQSEGPAAVVSELCDRVADSIRIRDEAEPNRTELAAAAESSCINSSGSDGGGGDVHVIMESSACFISSNYVKGIKGVRSSLLKSPPGMNPPVIDNTCSTQDISRDFAPKAEITPTSVMDHRVLNCSSDDEEVEVERPIIKREEDDVLFPESCSFTTERDEDSSSTGRQSIYQLEQALDLLSQFEHENIYGTDKDESKLYISLKLVKSSLLNLYQHYQQNQQLREELAQQRDLRIQAERSLEAVQANLNVTNDHRQSMERSQMQETREILARLEETIAGYDTASEQAGARLREMRAHLRGSHFSGIPR